MESRLRAPVAKGAASVVRLPNYWYVACRSNRLGREPIARTILGMPLVLFRDADGAAHALLDRCPHRNVPLSAGTVTRAGHLQCAYHGWQFDGQGRCRHIPGLIDETRRHKKQCPHAATREQEGLVWVFATLDMPPVGEPYRLGLEGYERHTIVVREVEAHGTLHAVLENALDVPHTSFLHRGLFRSGKRQCLQVKVARTGTSVQAEYIGESRPSGLIGRLLAPGAGVVEHWDRFHLPSIAQVEYRMGQDFHFVVTALCTPVSDYHTRLTAVAAFSTPLPGFVLRPILTRVGLRIFSQDARILRAQSESIRRFGGEHFSHTELDILGPHIGWLLRRAERGDLSESKFERELSFLA